MTENSTARDALQALIKQIDFSREQYRKYASVRFEDERVSVRLKGSAWNALDAAFKAVSGAGLPRPQLQEVLDEYLDLIRAGVKEPDTFGPLAKLLALQDEWRVSGLPRPAEPTPQNAELAQDRAPGFDTSVYSADHRTLAPEVGQGGAAHSAPISAPSADPDLPIDNGNLSMYCETVHLGCGCVRGAGHSGPHVFYQSPKPWYPHGPVVLRADSSTDTAEPPQEPPCPKT